MDFRKKNFTHRAWLFTFLLLTGIPFIANGQDYVGDQACQVCHANMPENNFFEGYVQSGHPYKLSKVEDGEPPEWPHTDPPPLPEVNGERLTWDDISYVIGNYFWKARFIDQRGFIYTGGEDDVTQWNIQNETWAGYHAGEVDKPYNCGRCHTTGYDSEGHQDDLPGLVGTWSEPGIRCEACHGPGADHGVDPENVALPGGLDCASCHYRDEEFRMPWKGGFMRHHQQAEDFRHSAHYGVDEFADGCATCHDPHKSTLYELGGMKEEAACTNCHTERNYLVQDMEQVSCKECHMPHMSKSAVKWNDHKADVRGHLFWINPAPIMAVDNIDTVDNKTYWAQNDNGYAYVTLDYACMGCHVDANIEELHQYANDIHQNHPSDIGDDRVELPLVTGLDNAYPNPFNSETRIGYSLRTGSEIRLSLLDQMGREVTVFSQGYHEAGSYEALISAQNIPTGAYYVRLVTPGLELHRKVVLLK